MQQVFNWMGTEKEGIVRDSIKISEKKARKIKMETSRSKTRERVA